MARLLIGLAAGALLAGCDSDCSCQQTPRIESLDAQVWEMSEWISVAAGIATDYCPLRT